MFLFKILLFQKHLYSNMLDHMNAVIFMYYFSGFLQYHSIFEENLCTMGSFFKFRYT